MKQAFSKWLENQIAVNPRVHLLTGDLGYKTFENIQQKFPQNFINMGVSEQNMVGVAAGLAIKGYLPFCYSIAPFLLLRAYEQIRNDLGFNELSVGLIGNGGGLAYGLQGSSHHCLEDLALMSLVPNMKTFFPAQSKDVPGALDFFAEQIQTASGPAYFRLSHDLKVDHSIQEAFQPTRQFFSGQRRVVVALGSMGARIFDLVKSFPELEPHLSLFVVSQMPLKLTRSQSEYLQQAEEILVVEEHQSRGGLASQLTQLLLHTQGRLSPSMRSLSVDQYQDHQINNYFGLLDQVGLSKESIKHFLEKDINKKFTRELNSSSAESVSSREVRDL